MEDFLKFKKMITPLIIQILFWIVIAFVVIMGLASIIKGVGADYGGGAMVMSGLLILIFGPVAARIYCEILIVIFNINNTLTDIRNKMGNNDQSL